MLVPPGTPRRPPPSASAAASTKISMPCHGEPDWRVSIFDGLRAATTDPLGRSSFAPKAAVQRSASSAAGVFAAPRDPAEGSRPGPGAPARCARIIAPRRPAIAPVGAKARNYISFRDAVLRRPLSQARAPARAFVFPESCGRHAWPVSTSSAMSAPASPGPTRNSGKAPYSTSRASSRRPTKRGASGPGSNDADANPSPSRSIVRRSARAAQIMYGRNDRRRQLIEPRFRVESHRYQTLQAADWIAGPIGRLGAVWAEPAAWSENEVFRRCNELFEVESKAPRKHQCFQGAVLVAGARCGRGRHMPAVDI